MENKKRLAIINAVPYGSTGKIVRGIDSVAQKSGMELYSRSFVWFLRYRL